MNDRGKGDKRSERINLNERKNRMKKINENERDNRKRENRRGIALQLVMDSVTDPGRPEMVGPEMVGMAT